MSAGEIRWREAAFDTALRDRLASLPPPEEGVRLHWLGQAGFVVDVAGQRLLIDPYLSNSLARKYRGSRYGHVRMMASPIAPEDFDRVDLVLCTHRHTDHMDPDTLQPLAAAHPGLRFVVPAASTDEALRRCGVPLERLVPVDVGDDLMPLPSVRILPLAAAHETRSVDAQGRQEWLGYLIEAGGVRLYHSGDCVPYPGLADSVAAWAPHVALLPVNGRDKERAGNGIPGNFTLDEAIALCHTARVPTMVAHHYGLFAFNTVSPETIDIRVSIEAAKGLNLIRARMGVGLTGCQQPPAWAAQPG